MIDGLAYYPNYITPAEEYHLLNFINSQNWLSPFQRRVQHYGYMYDYRRRTVDASIYLGDLPDWLMPLARRLQRENLFGMLPDQVIINEYEVGQGIAPHIDCEPCFEDTIVSISLGSQCVMDFYSMNDDSVLHQPLAQRSLLRMSGKARYDWKHGVVARKSDVINDERIQRERRISLTFRKVILS